MDALQQTISETPGTLAATPVPQFNVVATVAGDSSEAAVAGIDPSVWQDAGALIINADRAAAFEALRGGGAVLVPESFATRTGVTPGDVVHLAIPSGPEGDFRSRGWSPTRSPVETAKGRF